jgi:hypothetical protein
MESDSVAPLHSLCLEQNRAMLTYRQELMPQMLQKEGTAATRNFPYLVFKNYVPYIPTSQYTQ